MATRVHVDYIPSRNLHTTVFTLNIGTTYLLYTCPEMFRNTLDYLFCKLPGDMVVRDIRSSDIFRPRFSIFVWIQDLWGPPLPSYPKLPYNEPSSKEVPE